MNFMLLSMAAFLSTNVTFTSEKNFSIELQLINRLKQFNPNNFNDLQREKNAFLLAQKIIAAKILIARKNDQSLQEIKNTVDFLTIDEQRNNSNDSSRSTVSSSPILINSPISSLKKNHPKLAYSPQYESPLALMVREGISVKKLLNR